METGSLYSLGYKLSTLRYSLSSIESVFFTAGGIFGTFRREKSLREVGDCGAGSDGGTVLEGIWSLPPLCLGLSLLLVHSEVNITVQHTPVTMVFCSSTGGAKASAGAP